MLQLLEDLHSQTGAKVCSGRKLSSRFNMSSDVRQGCILAPALFCIARDWILSQVAPQIGITVGDQCFTDLAYADDAVIFLSVENQAADCFSALSNAAAPFGLRMSWTKQKCRIWEVGSPPVVLLSTVKLSKVWKSLFILAVSPRKTWTSQIPDNTGMSSRAYWDASIRRGHRRGTLRSLKTTRWW